MLLPAPLPPRPGLLLPAGDMARDPVFGSGGTPIFDPGWLDITVPESLPLPPFVGGAMPDPRSLGAPSPGPLRPMPDPVALVPPPTEGGGGTTLSANKWPPSAPAAPPVLPVPPPVPASEGGGGTRLGFPT